MPPIPFLEDNNFTFPRVTTALIEPDGLLAASELLDTKLVINAYQQGIFPWYSEGQPILWWSPNPRCVLFPEKFHISRSFQRVLNKTNIKVKTNTVFREVMLACAKPRTTQDGDESGTWITHTMLDVYCQLHEQGFAHSIECWDENKLVGGMYGLIIGDIFFGESMFSQQKNASKIAMHFLCSQIKPYLLDAQVHSKHLESLGAEQIDRADFIHLINLRRNKVLPI